MEISAGDWVVIDKWKKGNIDLSRVAIFEVMIKNRNFVTLKNIKDGKVLKSGHWVQELRKLTDAEKVLFGR